MRYDRTGKWLQIGRYWVRLSDGLHLPVIQGGGKAVTVQNARFAFGDDDGSESAHSLDTENTDRASQVADVTFLIRIQIEETGGGDEVQGYSLQADKNSGGTFTEVTTARADGINIANDTQSRADDEAKYDDGQTQQGTGSLTLNTQYTDLEFAIQIDSANAVDTDYWEFRVETAGGVSLDSYPGTLPKVTASILATPEIEEVDNIGVSDSVAVELDDLEISVSDNIGVSETAPTVTLGGDYEIEVSDNIGVSDSADVEEPDPREISVSDNVGVSDAADVEEPDPREISVSDSIDVADAPEAVATIPGTSVSDNIGVSDSLPGAYQDNVVLGEYVEVYVEGADTDRNIDVSDNTGVSDSATVALDDLEIDVSDSLSVDDTLLGELDPLEIYAIDNVGVSDSALIALDDLDISVSDNIGVSDVLDRITDYPKHISVSDNVSISDSVIVTSQEFQIVVSDNITVGDSAQVEEPDPREISVSDNIGVDDTTNVTLDDLSIWVVDNIGVSDSAAAEIKGGELYIDVSDGIGVTDVLSISSDVNLSVSDAINVTDEFNRMRLQGSYTGTIDVDLESRADIIGVGTRDEAIDLDDRSSSIKVGGQ
jgi:hypothetical protein